jgi:hypothetical protein
MGSKNEILVLVVEQGQGVRIQFFGKACEVKEYIGLVTQIDLAKGYIKTQGNHLIALKDILKVDKI